MGTNTKRLASELILELWPQFSNLDKIRVIEAVISYTHNACQECNAPNWQCEHDCPNVEMYKMLKVIRDSSREEALAKKS